MDSTTSITVTSNSRHGTYEISPPEARAALALLTGSVDNGAQSHVLGEVEKSGQPITLRELADRVIQADARLSVAKANKGGYLVACDCGHKCPKRFAMTTARGTACPECYDRMSA